MSNSNSNQQPRAWDDGTYQTGARAHEKHSSGLTAGLLAGVILLGGLASALGMMNIRLLARLQKQETGPSAVRVTGGESNELPGSYLRSADDPLPQLPADASFRAELGGVPKDALSMTGQEILEANKDSLVTVTCDSHSHVQPRGLGVILSDQGYILVNASAISHAGRIFVHLPDGRCLRAALAGRDEMTDVAVLYVEAQDLDPVELGRAWALDGGDPIYAAASAITMEPTQGALEAPQSASANGARLRLLPESGTEGDFGPVFNRWGQMIGLRVGRISRFFDGLPSQDLTLPAEELQDIVSQLVRKGTVAGRPSLGLETEAVSLLYQQYWGLPGGLQVTAVTPDGPAEAAGLQPGDILTELSGTPLSSREDLAAVLYAAGPGDCLEAVVLRGGQQLSLTLTVEQS